MPRPRQISLPIIVCLGPRKQNKTLALADTNKKLRESSQVARGRRRLTGTSKNENLLLCGNVADSHLSQPLLAAGVNHVPVIQLQPRTRTVPGRCNTTKQQLVSGMYNVAIWVQMKMPCSNAHPPAGKPALGERTAQRGQPRHRLYVTVATTRQNKAQKRNRGERVRVNTMPVL